MSASTDRLDELEAGTAPLPWPVDFFEDMPDDAFQFLFSLSQAWPHLREEIVHLETENAALHNENYQLQGEHVRLAAGTSRLQSLWENERELHRRNVAELAERLRVTITERDTYAEQVANLPVRFAAAEAVCRSIDSTKKGSGGAFGHFDGEAHDAWKKVAT